MEKTTELFVRYPGNPILTSAQLPYSANTLFNPAAVSLPDGKTLLLARVEDFRGLSHLTASRSIDGVKDWIFDSSPTLPPDLPGHPEEEWGTEDARVVFLPELGLYAITYTAYSKRGPGVALALTENFKQFERYGLILPPENKDAALFPVKINGRWALIHRPATGYGAHLWISFSPDLRHWGDHQVLLEARSGGWWDANKIGLSPPPIWTPKGWLVIYHGVRQNCAGCLYRLGLALFDLEDPTHLLKRGDEWVFGPQETYEQLGDVGNVTFPCGTTLAPDGDTLRIYYGAADSTIALAFASLKQILAWLDEHNQ